MIGRLVLLPLMSTDCYRSIVKKGVNERDFIKEISRLAKIRLPTAPYDHLLEDPALSTKQRWDIILAAHNKRNEHNVELAIASATQALNMELQRMRFDGEPSCDGGIVSDWPRADYYTGSADCHRLRMWKTSLTNDTVICSVCRISTI